MAFVYKPVVTSRKNGKQRRRRSRYYWASYTDVSGKKIRRVMKLSNGSKITNRRVAEAELRQLVQQLERKSAGLVDPSVESARIPIRVVLARFVRHLRALRRSRIHVFKTRQRVKWLAEHGEINQLADVTGSNISKALRILSNRNRAPKTINDYRAAMFGMCQWALKVERLIDRNPLESVPLIEINGDVRKVRRALTPVEAVRLLDNAGPRALWYELAMFTGLRVSEIAALEWRDIEVEGARPSIRLRAKTTKAKRADRIPLRIDLVTKLVAARPTFAIPTHHVFKTTPTGATFRRDCERVGISWQADERGRTLDRHSLRTTFVTWLSVCGVDPRTAQELARHTDISLTMQNYTDPKLINLSAAIEKLPSLESDDAQRKTGTCDTKDVVLPVVLNQRESRGTTGNVVSSENSAPSFEQEKTRDCANIQDVAQSLEIGGGGNRTPVPKHFSLSLYVHSRSF